MGKRNKRARTMLKKMSMLNEIPTADAARKYGIEEQVNARILLEEENSVRIQKLKEAQEAEERAVKLKAEQEAKKVAEAKKQAELKAKKDAEVKLEAPKKTTKTTTSNPKVARKRTTRKTKKTE